MTRTVVRSLVTLTALALVIGHSAGAAAQGAPPGLQRLQREILAGDIRGASHGDLANYRPALLRIYADSTPRMLWFSGTGLTAQGEAVLGQLASAADRGLRPTDYDAPALSRAIASLAQPHASTNEVELWRADAWLTLSAMRFMDHAHRGRADPRALGFAMPREHGRHDFAVLAVALGRTPSVRGMVDSLEPPFARFRQLEQLLARYRTLDGDSVRRRVTQMELAMERWRWLPDITASRIVVVNIPAFRLLAIDRSTGISTPAERMDVIVGSAYGGRRTPVFARDMREVVFHPYWDVPPGIARREEIPHIRRDPGYAEREGFEIVQGGGDDAKVYPLTRENLGRAAAGTLRLRQRPGPRNALGGVKFVFPNAYNVYLHGTPAQSLFARARRDFSHGCIRTSNPRALAEFVLAGQPGWDRARIAEQLDHEGPTLRVSLASPVPVFILYVTAVAADDGTARFYPDIYGHDARLARVLGLPWSSGTR